MLRSILLASAAIIAAPALGQSFDSAAISGLGVRNIGSATMSGRIAAVAGRQEKDGDEFTYWLDPDTWLEIKIDEVRRIRGAQQTNETELGDYEKVGGVYFPMSVESWQQGQPNQRQWTILASGAANPPVSAAFFAEPGGPATLAKASPEPPDASQKPLGKKPAAAKKPPANPSKPKGGR